MKRREFVRAAGMAAAGGSSLARWASAAALHDGATRRGVQSSRLALDAMGEIRITHTRALLAEVIDSGTRMVTVTLTDPKVFGEAALDAALDDLRAYDRHISDNDDLLLKATSVADIDRAIAGNRIALFYLLQNSTPIHKDVERLDLLYNLGLRSLQLTYNYANYVGSGCRERGDYGLTVFGHEVVERMNEIGMLVDTSHANMRTMAEAIEASTTPTIVSHTACEAVWSHVRNTTDDNLRLLAEHGGVVGICQLRPFLTHDLSDDNVRHYFDHIDHAVNVGGIEHVCIGSDRDHRVIEDTPEELEVLLQEEGAQLSASDWPLYMPAMNGPRRMEVVSAGLSERGYSDDDIDRIMSGNLRRLYAEVIG
jgi:membrane dipeptidase